MYIYSVEEKDQKLSNTIETHQYMTIQEFGESQR